MRERVWQAPFWGAVLFLLCVTFWTGECDPGSTPKELVGVWQPVDGELGFVLQPDGSAIVSESADLDNSYGVSYRWSVKRGELRLLSVGEEGETSGPWETTPYSLSSDGKTLTLEEHVVWRLARELRRKG
ncbi:MAG TPA: hypothetical protein VK934_04175 [Fimbriimonas sp.]|nr:hypothetical protein [Fimbriimonas sp.]